MSGRSVQSSCSPIQHAALERVVLNRRILPPRPFGANWRRHFELLQWESGYSLALYKGKCTRHTVQTHFPHTYHTHYTMHIYTPHTPTLNNTHTTHTIPHLTHTHTYQHTVPHTPSSSSSLEVIETSHTKRSV